jgi:hypothetical protein
VVLTGLCFSLSVQADGKNPAAVASAVHARGGYASVLPRNLPIDSEGEDVDAGSRSIAEPEPADDDSVPLSNPPRSRTDAPFFVTAVLPVVMIAALVAVLIAAVIRLLQQRSAPASAADQRPAARKEPAEESSTPDITAHIATGNYNGAVHLLFLLACEHLGALAHVRDRSRTAREILAGVSGADPRSKPFRRVVELAERVRFAGERASLADVNDAKEAVAQLRELEAGP